MSFPFMLGAFRSDKKVDGLMASLIQALQQDGEWNAKITQKSQNDLSFSVRSSNPFVKNSFAPNVSINAIYHGSGSSGTAVYSLHNETKAILGVFLFLALAFEVLMLTLYRQLASPFLMLIPVGLLLFAGGMTVVGLYLSAKRMHRWVMETIDGASEKPLKVSMRASAVMDNDWRLNGQEAYLQREKLVKVDFRKLQDKNDHDHCAFCWARFSNLEDDLYQGYMTLDGNHIICDECFQDFKRRFKWRVTKKD